MQEKSENTISIQELNQDPNNARLRTDRSAKLISESLEKFGTGRSIVIDENNTIIAGNGTIEGAKAAGVKNVLSKSLGSNNQLSVVSATLDGLSQLRTASQISEIRGETVNGPTFTQVQPKENVSLETKTE